MENLRGGGVSQMKGRNARMYAAGDILADIAEGPVPVDADNLLGQVTSDDTGRWLAVVGLMRDTSLWYAGAWFTAQLSAACAARGAQAVCFAYSDLPFAATPACQVALDLFLPARQFARWVGRVCKRLCAAVDGGVEGSCCCGRGPWGGTAG